MNENTFLGLFKGQEVGILNYLQFNSLLIFVELKSACWMSIAQAECLQGMFCSMWAFQSVLGTDRGWEGQKLCRIHFVFSCSRQAESPAGIPAAIPPFLFARCHFPKIHADLFHVLQLTEKPHCGGFLFQRLQNQGITEPFILEKTSKINKSKDKKQGK